MDKTPAQTAFPRSGYCERGCHHPHVHCVIPAGGLSADHQRWVHPRYRFFLPVTVLSRVFRGKFVDGLKRAFRRGELCFPGALKPLAQEKAFRSFLRTLMRRGFHDRWSIQTRDIQLGKSTVD